jgi:hypothetical protein
MAPINIVLKINVVFLENTPVHSTVKDPHTYLDVGMLG